MERIFEFSRGGTTAKVNLKSGQLFSLKRDGTEVIWPGGAPENKPEKGWKNSEIIMFPTVGVAKDGKITIDGTAYPMTQHGLSRDMPWDSQNAPLDLFMTQVYEAGTKVDSSKGGQSEFPRSFRLVKRLALDPDGVLRFSLDISTDGASPLPFAAGWHPAFFSQPDATVSIGDQFSESIFTLEKIRRSSGNAVLCRSTGRAVLICSNYSVYIGHNFGHTQIWDKGEGLVAIEPVTAPPLGLVTEDMAVLENNPDYRKVERNAAPVHLEASIKIAPRKA